MNIHSSPAPHESADVAADALALIGRLGVSDISVMRSDERRITAVAGALDGCELRAVARISATDKDWVDHIELRDPAHGLRTIARDNEANEAFAVQIGETLWKRNRSLVLSAQQAAAAAISGMYKGNAAAQDAHILDIERTVGEDGERQIRAKLVVEQPTLSIASIPTLSLSAESMKVTPGSPAGEELEHGPITFDLTLTEPVSALRLPLEERSIESHFALAGSSSSLGVSNAAGKALFYALLSSPELIERRPQPLLELAERSTERAIAKAALAELADLRRAIRKNLLGHLCFADPTDRDSLQPGDVVADVQPSVAAPGLSMQVFRIKAAEIVEPETENAVLAFDVAVDEVITERRESLLHATRTSRRRFSEFELPEGGSGILLLHFDHDLELESLRARRELSEFARDMLSINKGPETAIELGARVAEGRRFFWRAALTDEALNDPLITALAPAIGTMPIAIFPPADSRTISQKCGGREGHLERQVEGLHAGSLEAPGCWVLPELIVSQLADYGRKLAAADEATAAALAIAESKRSLL